MTEVGAYGAPQPISVFSYLPKRRSLAGSGVAASPDTQETLHFNAAHEIVCDIEMTAIDEVDIATTHAAADVKSASS